MLAKYCNKWTRVAVVRVRHGAHRLVASCLPLLQYVEKQNVVVRTLHTGATLRQCYRFIQVMCFMVVMSDEKSISILLILLSCCILILHSRLILFTYMNCGSSIYRLDCHRSIPSIVVDISPVPCAPSTRKKMDTA
jgi:hypothetical protein